MLIFWKEVLMNELQLNFKHTKTELDKNRMCKVFSIQFPDPDPDSDTH